MYFILCSSHSKDRLSENVFPERRIQVLLSGFNIRDDRKPENYPFPSIINTNNPPEKQGSATLFEKKVLNAGTGP